MEWRDGQLQYAQCSMFVRNYSDIVRYLDVRSSYDTSPDGKIETMPCSNGWMYDRRIFSNTVVMEVQQTQISVQIIAF